MQKVHVLLPPWFKIYIAGHPTFHYMSKKAKTALFLTFLKLLSNGTEFVTTIYMKKLLLFISFRKVYYMLNSDVRFKSSCISIKLCFYVFKKLFWTILSMKKWSTWESCVFSTAFHRYITCSWYVVGELRAKNNTWKTDGSSNTTAPEVQPLHVVHFRRPCFCDEGRTHDLRSSDWKLSEVHVLLGVHLYGKKNEKAKAVSFVARSSSARPKKVHKILVREVDKKYAIEVQGENSWKFNYYTKCVSGENKRM